MTAAVTGSTVCAFHEAIVSVQKGGGGAATAVDD